jgi:hypothetical protein
MQESQTEVWLTEAVLLQLPSGGLRYLIQVHQEPCTHCSTGTRVVSIWASIRGRCESVTWCGHCFNAVCEWVPADDERRRRFQLVQAAISDGRVSPVWRAARPAVEDLQNRGLI